ncbi:MAG TPA: complex I subunit 1 family protein [Patescibacteria group bacterium]|nr:complex I subunit 1 family protein [Patescibacteria group bacterium]
MTNLAVTVLEVLVFPGILFLTSYALYCNWINRKFVARLQNRVGPLHTGWQGILQPFADVIKLLAKEDITPAAAKRSLFSVAPLMLFALPLAALFVVPIQSLTNLWCYKPVASFEGDLIVVLFLLTIMILNVFLGGWSSANRFGAVGAERAAMMMIAYEIPLGLVAIAPAIMAGSLSITNIVDWQVASVGNFLAGPSLPGILLGVTMFIGAGIYVICLLAELEMRPFDISEAETEIVHGWQVEFSGKKLALITMGHEFKLVLAAALLTSLFLGGPAGPWPIPPLVWFVAKTTVCVFILSNLSVLFARFRIDQMLSWAWKYLVPLSVLQVMAVVVLSGVV